MYMNVHFICWDMVIMMDMVKYVKKFFRHQTKSNKLFHLLHTEGGLFCFVDNIKATLDFVLLSD